MKYDLLFLGVCLSVLGLGIGTAKGKTVMSHAPNLRGGQASDQATSGDQAGPGSNRRTNRAKGTHEKHRGQCMQGSRPSLPEASLNNRPDAPHESAYTTTITNANTSPTQQPPSQSITVHARPGTYGSYVNH